MFLTDENWPAFLASLASRVSPQRYQIWFPYLRLKLHNDQELQLSVPNRFFRAWILEKYQDVLLCAAEETCGFRPARLVVSISGKLYQEIRNQQRQASRVPDAVAVAHDAHDGKGLPRGAEVHRSPQLSSARELQTPDPRGSGGSGGNRMSAAFTPSSSESYAPPPTTGRRLMPASGRDGKTGDAENAGAQRADARPDTWTPGLNRDLKLEQFVVGPSNQLAHAVCQEVTTRPALAYNPLIFYGGTGLGKTHLLQGLCHALRENGNKGKVIYVPCEEFVNEFIREVLSDGRANTGRLDAFRARYRSADFLAVDDIHFLAGKDRSELEFCHTFDVLLHLGKQIVLSADAHPKEIPGLKGKLVTRMMCGLIVRLEAPCLETRRSILKSKAEKRGVRLPPDVLNFLAESIESNVRELEGAITRVCALSAAERRPVDLELVEAVLQAMRPQRLGPISLKEICAVVEKHYAVSQGEMRSKSRERRVLIPRQVAMYLTKRLTDSSYQTIGRFFGGRNHSTVLHAVRKITRAQKADPFLREAVTCLRRRLQP